jgi:hypothetical protein
VVALGLSKFITFANRSKLIMKKLFFTVASLMLLYSCQKESTEAQTTSGPPDVTVPITSVVNEDNLTIEITCTKGCVLKIDTSTTTTSAYGVLIKNRTVTTTYSRSYYAEVGARIKLYMTASIPSNTGTIGYKITHKGRPRAELYSVSTPSFNQPITALEFILF